MKNWKTSVTGIVTAVVALLTYYKVTPTDDIQLRAVSITN